MKKNALRLANHTFELKNIQTCDFMSEETVCFQADLYCDGKFLCYCQNEGHGGPTFTNCTPETKDRYYDIYAEVGNVVWIKCLDGHILYHNLGTVADEVLALIDLNKEVAKYQKNALVFEKNPDDGYDPNLYTQRLNATVKVYVQDYPGTLAKKIAELQDKGYRVLNTNIPDSIYEAAKEWRDPAKKKTC